MVQFVRKQSHYDDGVSQRTECVLLKKKHYNVRTIVELYTIVIPILNNTELLYLKIGFRPRFSKYDIVSEPTVLGHQIA